MECCRISDGTLLGDVCRRIPGKGKESCCLWQEAQGESTETIKNLENIVENHPECTFQNELLEKIKHKAESS